MMAAFISWNRQRTEQAAATSWARNMYMLAHKRAHPWKWPTTERKAAFLPSAELFHRNELLRLKANPSLLTKALMALRLTTKCNLPAMEMSMLARTRMFHKAWWSMITVERWRAGCGVYNCLEWKVGSSKSLVPCGRDRRKDVMVVYCSFHWKQVSQWVEEIGFIPHVTDFLMAIVLSCYGIPYNIARMGDGWWQKWREITQLSNRTLFKRRTSNFSSQASQTLSQQFHASRKFWYVHFLRGSWHSLILSFAKSLLSWITNTTCILWYQAFLKA